MVPVACRLEGRQNLTTRLDKIAETLQSPVCPSGSSKLRRSQLGTSAGTVWQSPDEALQFRIDDEVHDFQRHDADQAFRTHHESLCKIVTIFEVDLDTK
jgi:hypothetical protein